MNWANAGRGAFAVWNGRTTIHEKIPPSVSHRCQAFPSQALWYIALSRPIARMSSRFGPESV